MRTDTNYETDSRFSQRYERFSELIVAPYEIIAFYSHDGTMNMNTLCGQNSSVLITKEHTGEYTCLLLIISRLRT